MISDGSGGALLCWEDTRNADPDIYAIELSSNGATDPKWDVNGLPLCGDPSVQVNPVLARTDDASMVAAWQDRRSGKWKVYAQNVRYDVSVAATISLEGASAQSDGVSLSWYVVEDRSHGWSVFRSQDAHTWAPIASVVPDGRGRVAFMDREVESGKRYGYRLGTTASGVQHVGGEVWIEVPSRAVFALRGVRPNPASLGAVSVSFGLDHLGPASLSIVDLQGRKIQAKDLGALGSGYHVAALPTDRLSPGVYWVVLRSGAAVARRRMTILR